MKPLQRLPESEKTRAWKRDSLKYWFDAKMNSFLSENDYKLLELASGRMQETTYDYIMNPHKLKGKQYQRYPAKLRNFDFIGPMFLRWISEYNQRTFEPIVFTKNSNFDNEKLAYQKALIDESLQQRFVNMIVESGTFDPNQLDEMGNPVQPPMSEDVIKGKASSLIDHKTVMGQHAIDYICYKQDLNEKYRSAFEYFIKLNKCVTYKDILFDEPFLKIISPLNVEFWGNRNTRLLEDCEAIKVDYYLTFEELLEIFQGRLDEYTEEYGDILKYLESESARGGSSLPSFYNTFLKNRYGYDADLNHDISEDKRIRVTHIQFTSFRKVKRVLGPNEEILEFTEDYQGEDIVEEVWYPEEREGYVIAGKYFIGGDSNPIQRRDVDNPFTTKKNYNGLIFLQGDVEQVTPVERIAQYQEAYNVIQFKMQEAINKDMGKFITMPISLFQGLKNTASISNIHYTGDINEDGKPKYEATLDDANQDSAIAKNLYYTRATSVMFVDDTAEGFANAIQAIKAVDLSLGNWIEWLSNRADKLKYDAENLLGFNAARTGGIQTSEKVTNAQQNLISGSLITEEYYTEFEWFRDKDLQGLLDLSKYCFRIGKKANYVRSNRDIAVLEVDEGFSESSYGLFTMSGSKTKNLKDIMIGQATQVLQNSPRGTSTLMRIVAESNNYSSIIEEVEAKEQEFFETDQANKQADRENQLQIAQLAEQSKDTDRALKKYEIDTKAKVEIAKQGIMSMGFQTGKEGGDDITASIISETNKQMDNLQKNALKLEEIRSKESIATQNNETKLKVSEDNKVIARENKGQ
jgi:hypothetical protein